MLALQLILMTLAMIHACVLIRELNPKDEKDEGRMRFLDMVLLSMMLLQAAAMLTAFVSTLHR